MKISFVSTFLFILIIVLLAIYTLYSDKVNQLGYSDFQLAGLILFVASLRGAFLCYLGQGVGFSPGKKVDCSDLSIGVQN